MHWLGLIKGGPGSGNFGHAGRPGEVGGSAPDDTPGPQKVPSVQERESSRDLVQLDEDAKWHDATGVREVTVFHYSREDRTGSGLSRKFAGTAGAGEERRSFEYENGKLKEGTAPIHAYLYGATRESMIPSNYLHKIQAKLSVIDVGSQAWHDILDDAKAEAASTGRPVLAIAREQAVKRGYDALVSQRQGMMQILRDIRPEELSLVGREKSSSKTSLKYEPAPAGDSPYISETKRRWATRIESATGATTRVYSLELYSFQMIADRLVGDGLLTKDDRHALVGNMVGEDLPDRQAVLKKIEEFKSKISSTASDADKKKVSDLLNYGIVSVKSAEQVRDDTIKQAKELLSRNNKVAIRAPVDAIEEIVKDGRFKSQFETGDSQGALNERKRADVEYNSMGVPREVDKEHRPIYGYASDENGSLDSAKLEYYGSIAFVLKDEVKSRTTVTFGDSLDNGLAAGKFEGDVKLESIQVVEPGIVDENSFDYIEAQVHGQVKTDDVEEVLIDSKMLNKIMRRYKASAAGAAGEFEGFDVLPSLVKGDFKISIIDTQSEKVSKKVPFEDWIKTSLFKLEWSGTETGDALIANTEGKYGKKTGSDNRPSWW